jgi:hypothetical protein
MSEQVYKVEWKDEDGNWRTPAYVVEKDLCGLRAFLSSGAKYFLITPDSPTEREQDAREADVGSRFIISGGEVLEVR